MQLAGIANLHTVDTDHDVIGADACLLGRRAGEDIADLHLGVVRNAHIKEEHAEDHDREQQIHGGSGRKHGQADPRAGSCQTARDGGVVLALGAHRSADGQPVEGEIGALPAEEPDEPRWEPKAKFFDLDLEQAGGHEVAELVDKNDAREDGDKDHQ
jgi:hypothetical protein